MKKTILTVLTALLFLVSLTGMVSATTWTYNISMDNEFKIYLSTNADEPGELIGTGNDWKNVSTGGGTLTAGKDYFLHVYGYNLEGDDSPAGFLGDFSLSDNTYKFVNGTQTLVTNITDWTASKSGWGGKSWSTEFRRFERL